MAISIPIFIDDIKDYPDFNFSRCTYFSIECDNPFPDQHITIKDKIVPIHSISSSGIIYKPMGKRDKFDSVDQIEELFDLVESDEDFYIDINDLWIPNDFFRTGVHERGSVYRISFKMFILALSVRESSVPFDDLVNQCKADPDGALFESIETTAFKFWAQKQISEAQSYYQKNPQKKLNNV